MREANKETDHGAAVEYYDPQGRMYPALITAVWGPQCINVAFINVTEGQRDTYGQKIARSTSLMHGSVQQAHGNYWLWPEEERVPVKQPVDSAAV